MAKLTGKDESYRPPVLPELEDWLSSMEKSSNRLRKKDWSTKCFECILLVFVFVVLCINFLYLLNWINVCFWNSLYVRMMLECVKGFMFVMKLLGTCWTMCNLNAYKWNNPIWSTIIFYNAINKIRRTNISNLYYVTLKLILICIANKIIPSKLSLSLSRLWLHYWFNFKETWWELH